ncbi:integrin alpha-M isoform X1 [Hippocampus comes]|uniref:Integrin subunit alpha L n=1 Tax=Hippocampus comes TaxID=109280 RepID=A0A3Q2XA40_HIPCM|nr:PREDICTED: integrin alpha-L isoform X1 [Hippocampus comes]
MSVMLRLFLFMWVVALPVSLAFNIDTTNPKVYNGDQKAFFGYKVLQYVSGSKKGILVTAPLQNNGTGAVCKPDHSQTIKCFNPQGLSFEDKGIEVKHLGLSIAEDTIHSQFTVCSPYVAHECYDNSYLNSVCYKMTDDLQEITSFKPIFQECRKKTVDLVFLFDGSRSMDEEDFEKNKDFILDIMNSLKNTSIKFAAVQFATSHRTVFDFTDYQSGRARQKLREERHMVTLTNTHQALKFVLTNLFENQDAGASSDAMKVLVLITDGDPSDTDEDANMIINTYIEKRIIRFVIGVKIENLNELKMIASDPKDKYAFKIENYQGLTGLLENFQKHIFNIEGDTKVARAQDMTNEMSQRGFSAAFYKDILILGSVGSNSWRGALYERQDQTETQIEDSQMQMDSYMGYSVSVGQVNGVPLYFTGAPRFEHVGQIVVFTHTGNNWNVAQRINGEQIGSYFGADLCTLDVDSDGNSDFLLVGAPLFYHAQEKSEGQIYIYRLTDEMLLKSEINVSQLSMGRFGTSIASLADLNGDGLRDVAVGAPLEDANAGAVYIYFGDRHQGMRSVYSQRITGREVKHGIRFFGQDINGNIDLEDDALPDIVVGSYGAAIVLRSKPIVNALARLSFQPKEITLDQIDCSANTDTILPMVNLTACFEIVETTKSKAGTMKLGLNISYMLDVDPMRQSHRGFFAQSDKKSRNLTLTYQLLDKDTCFLYPIHMPKCVKDTLSPISIKLNFSQVNSHRADAVLNADAKTQAVVEVPFERKCKKNDTCIAEIEVNFKFLTPTLLVAEENYFNISITITNHGDDSYNTSLTMHYPPGLSYSRMFQVITQATRRTLHKCDDLDGVTDKTICGISLPVYRSKSIATFQSSFHISTEYQWNDTIAISVTGESDNNNSTLSLLTKTLPVQFEVKMAITVKEETTTYLNFTEEDSDPKRMVIIYKVDNPGWKAFPVNVSLNFPTHLQYNFEMENYQVFVQQNKTQCKNITGIHSEYCSAEKHCKIIQCDNVMLEKESSTEFIFSGDIQFNDFKERAQNKAFLKRYTGESAEVKFKSMIHIDYDKHRYVLDPSHERENKGLAHEKGDAMWKESNPTTKLSEVHVEFIISPDTQCIILTGTGLGLALLILVTCIMYKLGCFKRKTVQYYQEQEEEAVHQMGNAAQDNGLASQHASEPLAEEKTLLEDNQSADTEAALE